MSALHRLAQYGALSDTQPNMPLLRCQPHTLSDPLVDMLAPVGSRVFDLGGSGYKGHGHETSAPGLAAADSEPNPRRQRRCSGFPEHYSNGPHHPHREAMLHVFRRRRLWASHVAGNQGCTCAAIQTMRGACACTTSPHERWCYMWGAAYGTLLLLSIVAMSACEAEH